MPELYDFQKKTVDDLMGKKNIAILGTGFGKTAISMRWLKERVERTGKRKVMIVTTATKAKSGDMEAESDMWNGESWRASLDEFSVISWHKLLKWQKANAHRLNEYIYVFDEVAKSKGYTTGMGRAFQRICAATKDWTGYTATPGDKWIDLMPYMVATKLVNNKTDFQRKFCIVQTYKGYPEITHYLHEDKLEKMWRSITSIPDTTAASKELPRETHKVITFKAPSDYKQIIKTRVDRNGELIETTMGLCHYLRQICFTKEKREWLSDFIEGLGTNCVFFCNYIEEEDEVCEIAKKVLPKGAKIWRIDGKHHEIPAVNTIGKYDIVVAHYASGGEALNLQFMNYWCAISPNYSYSTSVQARGRIKRIGQKRPMFFYYLKSEKTIEDDIYDCLKRKSDFSEKTWCAKIEEKKGE